MQITYRRVRFSFEPTTIIIDIIDQPVNDNLHKKKKYIYIENKSF